MEIDISTLTETDIQSAAKPAQEQPKENKGNWKPRQGQGGRPNINLWEDTSIKPMKFEWLQLDYNGGKSFVFAYNDRTNNIPKDKIQGIRQVLKVLLDNKYTMRAWFKNDELGKSIYENITENPSIEWYLVSKNYNQEITNPTSGGNKQLAFQLAKSYNTNYDKIPPFVRAICARDNELLLGKDMKHPTSVLLIYTPCGSENHKGIDFQMAGQVAYIMKAAKELKIPIFNIANPTFLQRFTKFVKEGTYVSAQAEKAASGANDYRAPEVKGVPEAVIEQPKVPETAAPKEEVKTEIKVTEDIGNELFE